MNQNINSTLLKSVMLTWVWVLFVSYTNCNWCWLIGTWKSCKTHGNTLLYTAGLYRVICHYCMVWKRSDLSWVLLFVQQYFEIFSPSDIRQLPIKQLVVSPCHFFSWWFIVCFSSSWPGCLPHICITPNGCWWLQPCKLLLLICLFMSVVNFLGTQNGFCYFIDHQAGLHFRGKVVLTDLHMLLTVLKKILYVFVANMRLYFIF